MHSLIYDRRWHDFGLECCCGPGLYFSNAPPLFKFLFEEPSVDIKDDYHNFHGISPITRCFGWQSNLNHSDSIVPHRTALCRIPNSHVEGICFHSCGNTVLDVVYPMQYFGRTLFIALHGFPIWKLNKVRGSSFRCSTSLLSISEHLHYCNFLVLMGPNLEILYGNYSTKISFNIQIIAITDYC